MKTLYMVFAGCVFLVFCMLEMKGVAMDFNQTAPKPDIYTSRSSGGSGYRSGSAVYYSSK
jgi:hypothetical protein